MSLSSLQLDAFLEVSRTGSFSKAATALHITQSALSQRILNLESELETALLVREPSGARLTDAGERLLRYCQTRRALEDELVEGIRAAPGRRLAGPLRIAGYSTVMRSVIMPALASLVRENPGIRPELAVRELRELPGMLRRGETDFIVLDRELESQGLTTYLLGHERNVLIEPPARAKSGAKPSAGYLDHDPEDTTTERFFKQNRKPFDRASRRFLDEIYSILDGVSLGWGSAVVPAHLLSDRKVSQRKDLAPLVNPVVLHHYTQAYYPRLHSAAVEALIGKSRALLSPGS